MLSDHGEKLLAVLLELCVANASNAAECGERLRSSLCKFGECLIPEDNIWWDFFSACDFSAACAQRVEESLLMRLERDVFSRAQSFVFVFFTRRKLWAIALTNFARTRFDFSWTFMFDPEAVIAAFAFRPRCGVAKITKHKSSAARARVRVLLHHAKFRELCISSPRDCSPIDW